MYFCSFQIESIIIHPDYKANNLVNDIALMKLKENVVGGDSNAGTVCIPPVSVNIDDNFPVDNTAFAAGWGFVGENIMPTLIKAKEVMIPLVEDDICKNTYIDVANLWLDNGEVVHNVGTDTAICAGYPNGINPNNDEEADACQGDSGGSLVRLDADAGYELVGLTSWGYGCARTYGVFTQVGSLVDWINESKTKLDNCADHSDCVDRDQIEENANKVEIICDGRILTQAELDRGCDCKKEWKPMVCPDDEGCGLTQADIEAGCECKKGKKRCPPVDTCSLTEAEILANCICKKGNKKCPAVKECGLTDEDKANGCFCKKNNKKCPGGGGSNTCGLTTEETDAGCTCKKNNKKCPCILTQSEIDQNCICKKGNVKCPSGGGGGGGGSTTTCHGTCQCQESKKGKLKVVSCSVCPANCKCGKKIKCK